MARTVIIIVLYHSLAAVMCNAILRTSATQTRELPGILQRK